MRRVSRGIREVLDWFRSGFCTNDFFMMKQVAHWERCTAGLWSCRYFYKHVNVHISFPPPTPFAPSQAHYTRTHWWVRCTGFRRFLYDIPLISSDGKFVEVGRRIKASRPTFDITEKKLLNKWLSLYTVATTNRNTLAAMLYSFSSIGRFVKQYYTLSYLI